MVKLIAHRGNTNGPNPERENSPEYIKEALDKGFDVEIDVWKVNGNYYLGHDAPEYEIEFGFLMNDKLWCHAKNFEALDAMIGVKDIHCFSHDNDPYTITSKGIIWVYPGGKLTKNCVCVMPERYERGIEEELKNVYGICGDYVSRFVIV